MWKERIFWSVDAVMASLLNISTERYYWKHPTAYIYIYKAYVALFYL